MALYVPVEPVLLPKLQIAVRTLVLDAAVHAPQVLRHPRCADRPSALRALRLLVRVRTLQVAEKRRSVAKAPATLGTHVRFFAGMGPHMVPE